MERVDRASASDAPEEGILGMEVKTRLSRDEGGSGEGRQDQSFGSIQPSEGCCEARSDNTLLNPSRTLLEHPISGEACQLGARASTAGGAVVSLSRTEDKVPRIRPRGSVREELDVIDFRESVAVEMVAYGPSGVC